MENRKQWQYVGEKKDIIIRFSNQKGSSSCKRFLVLVTISLHITFHKGVHQENFNLNFFKTQRFINTWSPNKLKKFQLTINPYLTTQKSIA